MVYGHIVITGFMQIRFIVWSVGIVTSQHKKVILEYTLQNVTISYEEVYFWNVSHTRRGFFSKYFTNLYVTWKKWKILLTSCDLWFLSFDLQLGETFGIILPPWLKKWYKQILQVKSTLKEVIYCKKYTLIWLKDVSKYFEVAITLVFHANKYNLIYTK